jgi:hypothetical protein
LDAEEQALLRQKDLYASLAQGEVDLENAKAEDLVAMR